MEEARKAGLLRGRRLMEALAQRYTAQLSEIGYLRPSLRRHVLSREKAADFSTPLCSPQTTRWAVA